mgnify:CR=1 FL=1|tara:strand:+ start:49 stop:531 length:483 start_codon:yes stop_codon:yes gene_type:complete
MATSIKKKVTAASKLPPNPFIFEILDLVNKQRSNAKRVEVLKEYATDALKSILIWNFDDTVISMIPEGEVPYEKNEVPAGTDHTSLRKEWKNLYHFVKGGNDSLSQVRRETMFIQILEGLHPQEAEILCLVKDKGLRTKYKVTLDNVKEAYPDIQWGGRS